MTLHARVLLVDDEPLMRIPLSDRLQLAGYNVVAVSTAEDAVARLDADDFDVAVVDLKLPGKNGLYVLLRAREMGCNVDAVVITAFGTIQSAVDAMKLGARDFLTKPFETEALLSIVDRYVKVRRAKSTVHPRPLEDSYCGMIARSAPMLEIFRLIDAVADNDATVIIQGETGTGKELVANAIHQCGPRRAQPFIKCNCASIPDQLFESELFGVERGAFTGADRTRKGRFELAANGTLFLDEIDEMPLALQTKVLRVLQEREIERLGGGSTIRLDVRVLAATKVDLRQRVAECRFREDLFYRLNVLPIVLPPLRERSEDIVLLSQHFLHDLSKEYRRPAKSFSSDTLHRLGAHGWPGNVRELRNSVARAVTLCPGEVIEEIHLGLEPIASETFLRREPTSLADAVAEEEYRRIRDALAQTGGHRGRAAKLLGISRKTLWEKLNRQR
jgi:two-component system response regulator AtoC